MAEMIDPGWTPARGYSHAAEIMRLLDAAKREPASVLLDRRTFGGRTLRDACDTIGRGRADFEARMGAELAELYRKTEPIPGRPGWRVDPIADREWYSAAWLDPQPDLYVAGGDPRE